MIKTIAGISLRTKLFIAFAAMAVFPLLFLNFMTYQTTEQALLKTVFERNRSFANNIADDIDLMFAEKIRMMKVAVDNTDIQSMNAAKLVPALSPLTANHHELLMAIVLAPNGDLLARSDGKKTTANYNDREYFRTAMSTGKTTISDVLRSKTTGKLDIGIAEPIKNPDQSIRGMLVIGVSLHKIKERIAVTRIDSSGYAYLVNKNGKVLMHPDQSLIDTSADFSGLTPVKAAVSGQSGSLEYEFNGQRMLASYSYVPSTGWGLVVQEPLDEAMAASTSLRNTNIILMAATILIAVAIVFVLAGFIFKPVAKLTEAVGKVAKGDLTTQISFKSSDEIGRLATAFNDLTSQLSREEAARHAAEKTSRETSEMFSLFMRHSPVYVFIKEVDSEGSRVLQASENFQDMVGIAGSKMIGKTMEELFPAEFAAQITAVDREVIAKGTVLKIDEDLNGRSYTTIKFPLVQCDRSLLAGYSIDVTERKRAEEERLNLEKQLLHAQKLESLGVLAGGIAHDFNNLLMAIMGNADLALMRLNPESPAVDNLKRIEQAAARAADLAKQMLAYSGKGKFVVEHLDISRLVEEMFHMLEVSISKKAVLRFNLTHPIPSVEADATQMRQIIMNQVINASEAIGDKSGVIAITTGCMDCDRSYLKDVWLDENLQGGLYVYLEVADSGCGMDKETLSKLFDPFFTTKFTGRGLGMAAVLGIVRGHKGAIKVYSELNRGTTFKILLPASGRPAELFNGHTHTDDWKGSGKVLLVDDAETIRGIGREMLEELGFTVITADDGRKGVAVFKENPDIDFVILDLTMPHMDGEQCFRELRQLKPDLKVIMSSGYSEQEVSEKFIGKGLAGFIQKPYKFSVLREAIKRIV